MIKTHTFRANDPGAVGQHLRLLRQEARLSQMTLALGSGISQRHLSCIETGRAQPSPATLHALLTTLQTPLERGNMVFLAAGFAPRYEALPLADPSMDMVRGAIMHVLQANNPAPAIVLDSHWQVLAANASTGVLFELLGLPSNTGEEGFNLLSALLASGGLGDHLVNAREIRSVTWQRAAREALENPALKQLLDSLPAPDGPAPLPSALPPLLMTHLRSSQGELRFLSTFTTFGMPQDITVASLRIEHLIPADAATWQVMTQAYGRVVSQSDQRVACGSEPAREKVGTPDVIID